MRRVRALHLQRLLCQHLHYANSIPLPYYRLHHRLLSPRVLDLHETLRLYVKIAVPARHRANPSHHSLPPRQSKEHCLLAMFRLCLLAEEER